MRGERMELESRRSIVKFGVGLGKAACRQHRTGTGMRLRFARGAKFPVNFKRGVKFPLNLYVM